MKSNVFSSKLFFLPQLFFSYRDNQVRDVLLYWLSILSWVRVRTMKSNFFSSKLFFFTSTISKTHRMTIKRFYYFFEYLNKVLAIKTFFYLITIPKQGFWRVPDKTPGISRQAVRLFIYFFSFFLYNLISQLIVVGDLCEIASWTGNF